LSVSRVGLTGIEKLIRIGGLPARGTAVLTRLECFLKPGRGVDSGRFEDAIRDAVRDVVRDDDGVRAERPAQRMAEPVRERSARAAPS
jgi:hypothetical protein